MNRLKQLAWGLSMVFGMMAGAAEVAELPLLSGRLEVDGRLDEVLYQDARFDKLSANDAARPADPATEAFMFTDGKSIYVACKVTVPEELTPPAEDDIFHYDYETIEIFIAPKVKEKLYYHFSIDPFGKSQSEIGISNPADYAFPWPFAMVESDAGYTAEIKIPLESIGLWDGLKNGDRIAMNVCRVAANSKDHYQSLMPLGGSFHQRDEFPVLVVGSFQDGARAELSESPLNNARQPKVREMYRELAMQSENIRNADDYNGFLAKLAQETRRAIRENYPKENFYVWPANPWQVPQSTFLPLPEASHRNFELTALHGEVVTLAVGIGNAWDKAVRFRVELSKIVAATDENRQVRPEDAVAVRRLVETALRTGSTQRDALADVDIHDIIDCRQGENEIIYLTIDTAALEPGNWTFSLQIKPTVERAWAKTVPVELQIMPVELPRDGKPYSLNFHYYNYMSVSGYGQSDAYRHAVLLDQKRNGSNVHLICPSGLSLETDESGNLIGAPDFREMDRLIGVFGVKDQIYMVVPAPDTLNGYGYGKVSGEIVERNFLQVLTQIREYLAAQGIDESNYGWYITDEPDMARAKNILPLARLIAKHAPKQKIFCTFYDGIPLQVLDMMNPYVNLWSPSFGAIPEQMKTIREGGRKPQELLFYAVSNRTYSPYASYRLMLWRALQRGGIGAGYWSYDDVGYGANASMWDDFDNDRSDYSVIYEGSRGPQASVRQLAWFRGIQDWRILELAQKSPAAQETAAEAMKEVLSKTYETNLADSYIEKIRERLK